MRQTRRVILPSLLATLLVAGTGGLAVADSGTQQRPGSAPGAKGAALQIGTPGGITLGDHHAPAPPRHGAPQGRRG